MHVCSEENIVEWLNYCFREWKPNKRYPIANLGHVTKILLHLRSFGMGLECAVKYFETTYLQYCVKCKIKVIYTITYFIRRGFFKCNDYILLLIHLFLIYFLPKFVIFKLLVELQISHRCHFSSTLFVFPDCFSGQRSVSIHTKRPENLDMIGRIDQAVALCSTDRTHFITFFRAHP